jgi:hypothetical protein
VATEVALGLEARVPEAGVVGAEVSEPVIEWKTITSPVLAPVPAKNQSIPVHQPKLDNALTVDATAPGKGIVHQPKVLTVDDTAKGSAPKSTLKKYKKAFFKRILNFYTKGPEERSDSINNNSHKVFRIIINYLKIIFMHVEMDALLLWKCDRRGTYYRSAIWTMYYRNAIWTMYYRNAIWTMYYTIETRCGRCIIIIETRYGRCIN